MATYTDVDQKTPNNDSSANTVSSNAPVPFGSQVDYEADGELVYVASANGLGDLNTTEPAGYSPIYANENSGNLMTTVGHKDDMSVSGNAPGTTEVDFTGINANHSLVVAALNHVDDTTPPTITALETADLDSDGYIDAIHVTFSEAISDSTVVANDWDVAGVTGEAFVWNTNGDTADDADIYITFDDGVLDTGATPLLQYVQDAPPMRASRPPTRPRRS